MRILVVEDGAGDRGFRRTRLKAEGYAVTCAHDGETAETKALEGEYGLVVLDVLLPKKNGLQVLDSIRQRKPIFR